MTFIVEIPDEVVDGYKDIKGLISSILERSLQGAHRGDIRVDDGADRGVNYERN